LERAFQTETSVNGIYYPKMVQEAEEDAEETATLVFSQARDAESFHARLYKKALDHLIAQRFTRYHVCIVCGYVAEGEPPQTCPICGAPSSKFEKVE
jgi:rubrerythrin